MKLAVSHTADGRIITLFDPAQVKTSAGTLRYVPQPGESHHELDVPPSHAGKSLHELAHELYVDLSSGKPTLEPRKTP